MYFVLRLDGFGRDRLHILACRAAARVYADFVLASETPHLVKVDGKLHLAKIARELRSLVAQLEQEF